MRAVLLVVAGLALAGPAQAEDFSGFYAGINAGYGFQRGDKDRNAPPAPATGPAGAPADGLPPSATGAVRAIAVERLGSRRATALPR
ncbi:hypothetical protein [Methylobacterium planeticum]|uniref:Porin family protein n=1 Tax=Methylobacterium planeticum TaxID=2615211 RepID=A0A6N6MV62_9HYPH|nr:hypothetical protein [Methylobacterium planeticum]KAB1075995.1 hypothetical protein F6X51_00150 [Methylobacterium planeticum]